MALISIDDTGMVVSATVTEGDNWYLTTSTGRPIWSKDFPLKNEDGTEEHILFGANYDDMVGKDFSSAEFYDLMWLHDIKELKPGTYYLKPPLVMHSDYGCHKWCGVTEKNTLVKITVDSEKLIIKVERVSEDQGWYIDGKGGTHVASDIVGITGINDSLQWGMLAEQKIGVPKLVRVFSKNRDMGALLEFSPGKEKLEEWVSILDKKLEGLL